MRDAMSENTESVFCHDESQISFGVNRVSAFSQVKHSSKNNRV